VVKDNPNAASPYTSWATAAATIQAAVDVAGNGDIVLVTNGVYDTGEVINYPAGSTLSNRVAIYKPVIVRSINGPDVTTIDGVSAIRCVYLAEGAILEGFTIANGRTRIYGYEPVEDYSGAGVWCQGSNAFVTNCAIIGNGAAMGAGAYHGTINNCAFISNRAELGGGGAYECKLNNCTLSYNATTHSSGGAAYGGTLSSCVLLYNSAFAAIGYGGGAGQATLYNCMVISNSASGRYTGFGGGVSECTVYNSTLTGNSSGSGGGADSSTLYNCTLTGNGAVGGGGARGGALYNCILTGNGASAGGGAIGSTLYSCTLTSNSVAAPAPYAGGAEDCVLYNCIVYSNGENYHGGTFQNSCTWPDPGGVGNITNDPQFVDAAAGDYRLQSNSPCINTGINQDWMIGATDLDGNPRLCGRVDMGAYEYRRRPSYRPNNDFDGDGRGDIAVIRPSTMTWHIFRSTRGAMTPFAFGAPGDIPIPADYDGDGRTDIAVMRPYTMTWHIFQSTLLPKAPFAFGAPGDKPVR
jgi:hypothetical protein